MGTWAGFDFLRRVRRLIFIFLPFVFLLPLRAETPRLLEQALQKVAADFDRWAYTQTLIERDGKGKVIRETVVRFDPSKPFAEQFTPLRVDGAEPDDGDRRKFRRRGERREKEIENAGRDGKNPSTRTLGELMEIDQATVVAEDDASVTYEVPLKKDGNKRLPPDKFRVTARVGKKSQSFETIVAELRGSLREKVVVKIKSGAGRIDFATVNENHAPTITAIQGGGRASVLLVPIGRDYDLKRDDFERVKPYSNRFGVEIGPLKSIDF